jgi:hypothetical protein
MTLTEKAEYILNHHGNCSKIRCLNIEHNNSICPLYAWCIDNSCIKEVTQPFVQYNRCCELVKMGYHSDKICPSPILNFKSGEHLSTMSYTEKLEYVLKLCIQALYESIEIAPLDAYPPNNGDIIQEAQYILEQGDKNDNFNRA